MALPKLIDISIKELTVPLLIDNQVNLSSATFDVKIEKLLEGGRLLINGYIASDKEFDQIARFLAQQAQIQ